MGGAAFGCVCILFALFIGLLIVSVILRAAVWIANKCLGESGGGGYRRSSDDYDDDWDDYERPARRRRGSAIPEPDLFKGMGIVFLVWVCSAVVSFVFAFLIIGVGGGGGGGGFGGGGNNPFGAQNGVDPALQIMSSCVQLVIQFLIWATLLTLLLPTSFGRASLVTVFVYLISFAIGVVIFGVLFVAGFGIGAMGGLR